MTSILFVRQGPLSASSDGSAEAAAEQEAEVEAEGEEEEEVVRARSGSRRRRSSMHAASLRLARHTANHGSATPQSQTPRRRASQRH